MHVPVLAKDSPAIAPPPQALCPSNTTSLPVADPQRPRPGRHRHRRPATAVLVSSIGLLVLSLVALSAAAAHSGLSFFSSTESSPLGCLHDTTCGGMLTHLAASGSWIPRSGLHRLSASPSVVFLTHRDRRATHTAPRLQFSPFSSVSGSGSGSSAASSSFSAGSSSSSSAAMSAASDSGSCPSGILQPLTDERLYRYLTLPSNSLRAVLVSDPSADRAAVAMDVHVGSLADPVTIPGLAHFLEHMLFLGTEKFPDESAYSDYLAKHGGSSNAYTALEHTNYHLDVAPTHLEGAIDRFAQFFTSPLFSASGTERELLAVESENQKNLQSDAWRQFQLERSLASPDHPYFKFSTGNRATLSVVPQSQQIDTRAELLSFYAKHYSSDLMSLCIVGSNSLDELEDWTRKYFSGVPKRESSSRPIYDPEPYPASHLMRKVRVVPVNDQRTMRINWPTFPPTTAENYGARHSWYISHLLGHEGPGSALALLMEKGYATSLSSGSSSSSSSFDILSMSIELTPSGLENADEVAGIIFDYVSLLQRSGPQAWIWDENKLLADMQFKFLEPQNPMSHAIATTSGMQIYQPEDVVAGPYIHKAYDPELITRALESLSPRKAIIFLVSSDFADEASAALSASESEGTSGTSTPTPVGPGTWHKERWYGTQHSVEPFSESLLARLESTTPNPGLALPEPNAFIPTNFDILEPTTSSEMTMYPTLVLDTPRNRLWYKKDNTFNIPKASASFMIRTPLNYATPRFAVATSLLTQLIRDDLTTFSYSASLAGLDYKFDNKLDFLELNLSGYNDRQLVFLESILDRIVNFKINPERFVVLKERLNRALINASRTHPYMLAFRETSRALHKIQFSDHQLRAALIGGEEYRAVESNIPSEVDLTEPGITFEFISSLLPQLLKTFCIDGLIIGNHSTESAVAMAKLVEDKLLSVNAGAPDAGEAYPRPPARTQLILPKAAHYALLQPLADKSETNSALLTTYNFGPSSTDDQSLRLRAAILVIAQIIKSPAFNQLRTKEQLGYVVHSDVSFGSGSAGLKILVQSAVRTPGYIGSRVRAFMRRALVTEFETLSDESFQAYVDAVKALVAEKDKRLGQEAARWWSSIVAGHTFFDQVDHLLAALDSVTKEEVTSLFRTNVVEADSSSSLTIAMVSHVDPVPVVATPTSSTSGDLASPRADGDEAPVEAAHSSVPSSTGASTTSPTLADAYVEPEEDPSVSALGEEITDLSKFRTRFPVYQPPAPRSPGLVLLEKYRTTATSQ
ncbi:hypothetical protein H696_04782 [Fonticula alba]|uniref:Insulysin n=1 Tax=Fonticula alba TaxID=691883 RepID=A0A058Z2K1_FONAL|nr:hypothetical protein H696_04782 [Fonticula alba]KCV68489.1 hypothetical protein H696_04782 [Fonticula alba]|eukprot:XP_009496921.1 hypothetical protein H696_04782 [Fonticula alba]